MVLPSQTESLALAPGAGSGVGRQFAAALLADPEFVGELVAAARRGLRATRSWYDKNTKEVVQEADSRVQVQTLALLLAHLEGEPIKRVIHEHVGAGRDVDLVAELRANPALRDAVDRLREKADWRTGGGERARKRLKQVGPTEVVEGLES